MSTEKPTYDEVMFVYTKQTKIYHESLDVYHSMLDLGLFGPLIHPIRWRRLEKRHKQLGKMHSYFCDWHKEIGNQFRDSILKGRNN